MEKLGKYALKFVLIENKTDKTSKTGSLTQLHIGNYVGILVLSVLSVFYPQKFVLIHEKFALIPIQMKGGITNGHTNNK